AALSTSVVQSDWAVPPPLVPDELAGGCVAAPAEGCVADALAGASVGEDAGARAGALAPAAAEPPSEDDDADVLDGLHPVARSAAAATADRANDVRRVRGPILIKKTSSNSDVRVLAFYDDVRVVLVVRNFCPAPERITSDCSAARL